MNLALIKQVAEFKAILGAQRAKLISFQLDSLDAKSVAVEESGVRLPVVFGEEGRPDLKL